MDFLRHILSREGVKPHLKKLQAIRDRKRLVIIKGIQSFLDLVSFYQKFIKRFLQMGKPLSNIFKKELFYE
jgi:hypothetical protein